MRCESCDIELTETAVSVEGHTYCCSGCADGGPCVCSYENAPASYSGNGHSDPALIGDALDRLGDWRASA